MRSMENFTVYKHIFPNGKVYIGITGRDPELRWASGNGYKNQPKVQRAIEKYGWENIEHGIIASGLTKEKAEIEEIRLIEKYNSIDEGYNTSAGGEHPNSGAYKYKIGDMFGRFELIGRDGVKVVLKCHDCGAQFERYLGSLQNGRIKCKCKVKYNPNPTPRKFRIVTFKGETKTLAEWSAELGIDKEVIWYRYERGLPIDESQFDTSWRKPKTCPICGEIFTPAYKKQKFCSNKCGTDSLKKGRPKKVCQYCGKEFKPSRAQGKEYKAMFCCIPCRVKWQQAQK